MDKRNLRKERIGVVTSNKMEKSIVVSEVKPMLELMIGELHYLMVKLLQKYSGLAPLIIMPIFVEAMAKI